MPLKARYSEGEAIPGPATWRDLVRLIRSRAIRAVPPLVRTVGRWGTDLLWGPPLRFDALIVAKAINRDPGAVPFRAAEALLDRATGLWTQVPGGRVVDAWDYNFNNDVGVGAANEHVPMGAAVAVAVSAAGDWRFNYIDAPGPAPCGTGLRVTVHFSTFPVSPAWVCGSLSFYYMGTLLGVDANVIEISDGGADNYVSPGVSLAAVPPGAVIDIVYHMVKAPPPIDVGGPSAFADVVTSAAVVPCTTALVTIVDPRTGTLNQ